MNRVKQGKFENLFISDRKEILRELIKHRDGLYTVDVYQWEKIPPVYRQVVFLAVYVFFAFSLLSNQVLENGQDIYFPIILLLKFVFYFGWFKVAEALRNPFGVDGDDFEIAAYLARNIWSCNVHLQSGMFGHPQEKEISEKEEEAEKSAKMNEKDGELYIEYIDTCNQCNTRCP